MLVALVACTSSTPTYGTKQDTNHIVVGNGSISVQYGNNIYFVNGYRGYEDSDGKQNNNVIKGGIFRAEVYNNGEVGGKFETLTYAQKFAEESGYDANDLHNSKYLDWQRNNEDLQDYTFVHTKQKDPNAEFIDDSDDINVATVAQIADKTVGTSGYSKGGIYIFDGYLYFASPSNQRDKNGTLLSNRTQFFKVELSTGKRTEVFSTSNDTNDSPYGFYKYKDGVHLVVLDGTNLVSIEAHSGSGKIGTPKIVAENVTSAIMPIASIYYKGMPQDYAENFVYFTTKDASKSWLTGNLVEMIRPNGSQRYQVLDSQAAAVPTELIDVRDGLLFYFTQTSTDSNKTMHYDNLWSQRRELAIKSGTKEVDFDNNNTIDAQTLEEKTDMEKHQSVYTNELAQVMGTFREWNADDYTGYHVFRSNRNSNAPEVLAIAESGVDYFASQSSMAVRTIASKVTINSIQDDGYVYYLTEDNNISRAFYNKSAANNNAQQLTTDATTTGSLNFSANGTFLVYFSQVDEWASDYTHFKLLETGTGGANTKAFFVGQRIDDDLRPRDDDGNVIIDEGGSTDTDDGAEDTTRKFTQAKQNQI